ncbi:MAG: hypothetical protein Q9194_003473 [Teloschistes cf. exilis]
MRRDPRENFRGLVDPRDARELLDNDGYGLHGEEEQQPAGGIDPTEIPKRQPVKGINPIEILAVANVEALIHARNKWIGEEGKDKETNTAHGMKSLFEAFGNFHCQGGGCAWGGPCDRHKEQFLMMNCQMMGYHGPWDPERVQEFLRPHYDFMKGSLAYYAAERGLPGNSAAEVLEQMLPTTRDPRGQGGPAFGPLSWGGGTGARGPSWGGGADMGYGPY